jgi:cytoskeletal protein RodZ
MTSTTARRRRHSPAVYRRRRLVLVLALLAIAAVVWLLIAQPWAGNASESTEASPAKTQAGASTLPVPSSQPNPGSTAVVPNGETDAVAPSPSATPGATPVAEPCVARNVTVDPVANQDTYSAGQQPQFSITLTNNGPDCTMNVGTSTQVFEVTSGSDTWWRSTDCQGEPVDMVVLLTSGQTVSSASPLTWDRTRSAVGTCGDPSRPAAPGGGASYHLSVEIGGISSTETAFFLLY